MSKKLCPKCNNEFSTRGGNYNKHISVCDGNYVKFIKGTECKHCGLDFSNLNSSQRANHSRWCVKNPKNLKYKTHAANLHNNLTEESRLKIIAGIKQAHIDGKYKEAPKKALHTKIKNGNLYHSEETKLLIREKALKSKHRRVNRNIIEYRGVKLDSTWEYELAKRLDDLGIMWTRPEPIEWLDDDNVSHNYFPDFYLIEHDLYLDPKNHQVMSMQKYKLQKLSEQYSNILILDSLEKCKNFTL